MMKHGLRVLFCCAVTLCLGLATCCVAEETMPQQEKPVIAQTAPDYVGYLDSATYGEYFLAVGTGGRMDRIDPNGVVTPLESGTAADLRGIWTDGKLCLICTADGVVLSSSDGSSFTAHVVIPDLALTGVTGFNGKYFVSAEDGAIYASRDLGTWERQMVSSEEPLLNVISTRHCIVAVSAGTDVLLSQDGINWTRSNFNEVYDGLYPPFTYVNVVGTGDTFFTVGYKRDSENIPVVMYTETAEVWMDKSPSQINGAPRDESTKLRLNDIGVCTDQIIAPCDEGQVVTLTECIQCNLMQTLSGAGDLKTVSVTDDDILIAGEDFYCHLFMPEELRQEKIAAEQVQTDMQAGAVLIDVRNAQERAADGYIPGSILIPVDEVAQRLPDVATDLGTEIIFYCVSGGRAQKALETAQSMGYYRVYNLGGLSDWPYEIAHDE